MMKYILTITWLPILCFRFINSLGYFGILFSTPTLSGDMFVNFVLSGAVEIPACFICMFALEK